MRLMALFLAAALLAGCAVNSSGGGRVFIREKGTVVTTYELDSSGKVAVSSTAGPGGAQVVREYAYDSSGRLASVSSSEGGARVSTTYMPSPARAGSGAGSASSAKTVVSGSGARSEAATTFYYGADGKLEGILQSDADGNVQSKCSED